MSEVEVVGNEAAGVAGAPAEAALSEPRISGVGALSALVAAMLWASVAAGFEYGLAGWLVACAGGALTLSSAQLAFRGVRRAEVWGRAVVYGSVLALPVLAFLALALKQGTNHRPLGAVTFSVLALGVLAGSAWLMARVDAWRRTAALLGGALVLGAIGVWVVAAAEQRAVLGIQWGVGLLLAAGCIAVDRYARYPALGERFGMVTWGVIVLANLAIGLAGWASAVDEVAPVVVGLVGLLR